MKMGIIKLGPAAEDRQILCGNQYDADLTQFIDNFPYHDVKINTILDMIPKNSNPVVVNNGSFQGSKELIIAWNPIDIVLFEDSNCVHISDEKVIVDFKNIIPRLLEQKSKLIDSLLTEHFDNKSK